MHAILSLLLLATAPQEPPSPERPTGVDWRDASWGEVARDLSVLTGRNFLVARALEDRGDASLTLRLEGVAAGALLRILKSSFAIEVVFEHEVFFLTTPEDALRRSAVVRIYDASAALYEPPDFVAPEMGLRGSSDAPEPRPREEPRPQRDVAELVELVVRATGASLWEQEGAVLQGIGTRLLVRHTPAVHRKVQRVLRALEAL
jgi:hypothetical protein